MLDALRRRGLLHSQTAALDPQLSDNALGPDGADAFGGALRRNSHLERIQLAGNGFEDGAAANTLQIDDGCWLLGIDDAVDGEEIMP